MGKEWITIKEIGQLYLEKILVSFDIPVLFVCKDFENRKYLCLNIDEESGKSVIAATNNKMLIDMLKDKISMESVFRNTIDNKIVIAEYDIENSKIVTQSEDADKISGDLLPAKGAFLELSNKEIEEYILFLSKQIISIALGKYSEKKTFTVQSCRYYGDILAKSQNIFTSNGMKLSNTIKNCSYTVTNNGKMIA